MDTNNMARILSAKGSPSDNITIMCNVYKCNPKTHSSNHKLPDIVINNPNYWMVAIIVSSNMLD